MRTTDRKACTGFLLVLVTGLISGSFLSRFLAENLYHHLTAFYHWVPTILLMGVVTMIMILRHLLLSKSDPAKDVALRDGLSYLPFLLLGLYLFQPRVNTVQANVLLTSSLLLVVSLKLVDFLGQEWAAKALLPTVFILPLGLYLVTLAPTVGEHDTFEFQVLSYELGIAHPTGYPLYILLGKLFTFLPVSNVAFRVNLSSALYAGATVVVLYETTYLLTRHRLASALAALTFGFTDSFWSQAVVAEVYALNALFVALISYLLLRSFYETAATVQDSRPRPRQEIPFIRRLASDTFSERSILIYATSFTYGLSLTHHRTMLLLAPALMTYVLINRKRCSFRLRDIVLVLIAFTVPVVGVHLYIPLRWWQIHGQIMTWAEFSNLVLGTQFAAALRWDAWFHNLDRLLIYLRILLEQYPTPALGLALLGLIWIFRHKNSSSRSATWKEGVFLLMAFVAYVLFGLSYYVPDVSLFLIPSHLIIAIGLGAGIAFLCQQAQALLHRLDKLAESANKSLTTSVTLTLFSLLPLSLIWVNMPRVDRSREYDLYEWGRYVLQQELPPGAVVLADSEKIAPLYYLQRIEGVRPDTETGVFPDEATNRAELERKLSDGKPVFLARFLPGLEGTYYLSSLGPLVQVSPHKLTELPSGLRLPDSTSSETRFGNKIVLRGYRLDSADLRTTAPLRLTLHWQADEHIVQNYDVRLRLVGSKGHIWHETKGRPPVNGLYPTAAWRPGEIVSDFHEIDVPASLPPGRYQLQVGLFLPFSQKGLTLPDADEEYLSLTEVSISPPAAQFAAMQHSLRMNFDNQIMLLGYDFPGTVKPGARVTLSLYWERIGQHIPTDYLLTLELAGAGGHTLWRSIEPPFFGEYPTSHWVEHQLIVGTHSVTIPVTATKQLELRIGLQHPRGHQPLPVVNSWLAGWQDQSILAETQIQDLTFRSTDENLPANFENKVSLVDYEVRNVQVRQGEALHLSLTWQGLTSMDEDYTVFVHLLDENERIWGQEDIQPAYGTHPTSRWKEGEIIVDPHTVWTDQGSPLGLYQIEVGLYLLRTMERLQVVDASGKALSNRVLIGPVEIVP